MKVSSFVKYSLFIFILAISSFEYFFRVSIEYVYYLFPIVLIGFYYYDKKFDYNVLLIILPFVFAFILQTIIFGSPFYYTITLVIRIITIYFAAKIIGEDFLKIFIQTIRYLAIVSILFYFLQYLGPTYDLMITFSKNFSHVGVGWKEDLVTRPNFIIYAIQTKDHYDFVFFRNSGPFYEPGLYAVFLNIALFLNLFVKQKIFDRINILFIISIITTFSTMGYIALILNLYIFSTINKSISLPIRVLSFVFLIALVPIISSLPFMTKKINKEFSESDISYSRFGAAVVHYNIIRDYPLSGIPPDEEIYANYSENISPNGITEIFIRYGIIAGIFYYILLFRMSSTVMNLFGLKGKGFAFFFILILVIFGETMGNKPIYWAIIFAQFPLASYLKRWSQIEKLEMNQLILDSDIINSKVS